MLKIYRIVDNIELLQGDCYRNILKYGYKRNKPLPWQIIFSYNSYGISYIFQSIWDSILNGKIRNVRIGIVQEVDVAIFSSSGHILYRYLRQIWRERPQKEKGIVL